MKFLVDFWSRNVEQTESFSRCMSNVTINSNAPFISIYSGGSNRLDDAIECYTRAANMFKMSKNWSQAGKAFCEAANLHAKSDSRHDAATKYVDASNCYKKTDPNEAVNCLLKAIEIYTDMGRFTMAAKHHQTIAEMYESEANDLVGQSGNKFHINLSNSTVYKLLIFLLFLQQRAVQHYEQAADYFKGEESTSSANKCMLKVAQYAAQLEDYDKAIKIYEQVDYLFGEWKNTYLFAIPSIVKY